MAIHSMTGIGTARVTREAFDVAMTIKSINHRYLNLQIRLPRGYSAWESVIRNRVAEKVFRGKTDVFVEIFSVPSSSQDIVINHGVADALKSAADAIAARHGIPSGLTAERLLRFPDVISTAPASREQSDFRNILVETVDLALDRLMTERRCEGEKLAADLMGRIDRVDAICQKIREHAAEQPGRIRERLQENLTRIADHVTVDNQRWEQEIAMLVMKADITEETVRIGSHLKRLLQTLQQGKNAGKRCDFLIQELHREATTIASKSAVDAVSELTVDLRGEIEKMREQVQNLE